MASSSSRCSGFTLLEMVVAIGIFAVIAAIVYPAIQRFLDARDQLNDKFLTALEDMLRKEVMVEISVDEDEVYIGEEEVTRNLCG